MIQQSGKALWWLLLVILLAGILGAYWYFNPRQQPDWVARQMPAAGAAQVTLYRWQDANGEWTLSDQPPAEGVDYEVVSYRHDTNVMPPVQPPDKN